MDAIIRTAIVVLSCVSAFGQTFDAADVHVSPPATNPYTFASGGILRGGRYDLRKATMLDLIKTAWNVDPDTVFGGPNWLELDRFDVSAKAPPATPPETIRLMVQALLRDRFGLVIHKDTRPMPAFALTAGKNKPRLTQSDGSTAPGCVFQPPPTVASRIYACHNITLDAFARTVRQLAPDYLSAAPVVNDTGLDGTWDFDLRWDLRARVSQPDARRTTIFDAVDQQLGLKLDMKTASGPVLVVDRVNEKPTPNLPDIDRLLPPRAVEFEVADLKPSRPGEPDSAHLYSSRFELRAFPMGDLIYAAFDITRNGATNDLIAGLPKWTDSARFDLSAKLPSDTFGPTGNVTFTDDLRLMVRNLLIDRFKIKFHYEDQPVSAYTLVSAKPKMKKADPSRRANCQEAGVVANDPRDANPRLDRLVTCQNVTMTQFAGLLLDFARAYAHMGVPVEDATGLDGAWDFTLSFSNPEWLMGPAASETASDPNGAISLEEAISKQLGLKLEKRPRKVPILVIDHMEETPTEN